METGTEPKTEVKVRELFTAKEVLAPERWDSLIEDCKEILVEHIVRSREAIIEMKWYLGDRLVEEGVEVLTESLVKKVGEAIKVNRADLFRCIAFRKRFPSLDELWSLAPEGKNISWHKLVNNYIDFSVPKPELPIEERVDTFGLLKWWEVQQDLSVLRLVHKDCDFTLTIKKDKAVQIVPEKHGNLRDLYKELGDYYIELKKWSHDDLNRNDYNRMNRSLKEICEKAHYDKEKVKHSIKWCHDQYIGTKIDWSLETVVKKYAEAARPIKDYERYLKQEKPRR